MKSHNFILKKCSVNPERCLFNPQISCKNSINLSSEFSLRVFTLSLFNNRLSNMSPVVSTIPPSAQARSSGISHFGSWFLQIRNMAIVINAGTVIAIANWPISATKHRFFLVTYLRLDKRIRPLTTKLLAIISMVTVIGKMSVAYIVA